MKILKLNWFKLILNIYQFHLKAFDHKNNSILKIIIYEQFMILKLRWITIRKCKNWDHETTA